MVMVTVDVVEMVVGVLMVMVMRNDLQEDALAPIWLVGDGRRGKGCGKSIWKRIHARLAPSSPLNGVILAQESS